MSTVASPSAGDVEVQVVVEVQLAVVAGVVPNITVAGPTVKSLP